VISGTVEVRLAEEDLPLDPLQGPSSTSKPAPGGPRVGADDLGAMARFDGVAVSADGVGLLPSADSIAQHLDPAIFDEAAFRALHRGFPFTPALDLLTLLCLATLLGLSCLGLQLAHQLRQAIIQRPALAIAPAALAALRPAERLNVQLAGRTAVVRLGPLDKLHESDRLFPVFLPVLHLRRASDAQVLLCVELSRKSG
jgi:hypothetical protein